MAPTLAEAVPALRAILRRLASEDKRAVLFCKPLDLSKLKKYLEVVKKPMDLGTVDRRLCATAKAQQVDVDGHCEKDDKPFESLEEVKEEISLVFQNTIKYSGKENELSKLAAALLDLFETLFEKWVLEDDAASNKPWESKPLPPAPWEKKSDEDSQPLEKREVSKVSSTVPTGKGRAAAVALGKRKSLGEDNADSSESDDDKSSEESSGSSSESEDDDEGEEEEEEGSEVDDEDGSDDESSDEESVDVDDDDDDDHSEARSFSTPVKGRGRRKSEPAPASKKTRVKKGPASTKKVGRPKKRPARDLKGIEIIFTCDLDQLVEKSEQNEVSEFKPHFEKLCGIFDWLERVEQGTEEILTTWKVEIIRRVVGATKGSTDSYFLTPEFKRLRQRKDVASFLGLSGEDQWNADTAFRAANNDMAKYFATSETAKGDENDDDDPLIKNLPSNIKIGARRPLANPIDCGNVKITDLGRIVDLPTFCTKRLVYPLGFTSECQFFSSRIPGKMTKYRNDVILAPDGSHPIFRVTDLKYGNSSEGRNPTIAWLLMIVDILIGIHKHWESLACGARLSDEASGPSIAPSNTAKVLAPETNNESTTSTTEEEEKSGERKQSSHIDDGSAAPAVPAVTVIENSSADGDLKSSSASRKVGDGEERPTPGSASPADNGSNGNGKTRKSVNLRDLVRIGKIDPNGPAIEIEYQSEKWHAKVTVDGKIESGGSIFETPSAFSISMKRTKNPSKMADDGWKSCTYGGETLHNIKKSLTDEEIELIEEKRKQNGEHDGAAKKVDANDIDLDAMDETLEGKGIGDKNHLAGAPKVHLLPQPHQLQWWQIDLTALLNEQLGKYLFGLDQPLILDVVEALPMMNKIKQYKFRVQRGTEEKENNKIQKRNIMLYTRITKAMKRIQKHQDVVDRRIEAAARRQMRLEDRFARAWRTHTKKLEKEAVAASRKEDREMRLKEKQSALEALRNLREEIKSHRDIAKVEKSSEMEKVVGELELEEKSLQLLIQEKDRSATALAKAESEGLIKKEMQQIQSDHKRANDLYERQVVKVDSLKVKLEKLQQADKEKSEKEEQEYIAKQELNDLIEQMEQVDEDTTEKEVLPDDSEVIESSPPLAIEAMTPLSHSSETDTILEVWDFLSKFAPDLGLCEKQPLDEGLYNPEKDEMHGGELDDEEAGEAGNEDDDKDVDIEDEDEDEDYDMEEEEEEEEDVDMEDEDREMEEDEESRPDRSAKKKSKKKGPKVANGVLTLPNSQLSDIGLFSNSFNKKKSKTRSRVVMTEAPERTPVILFPEVKRALEVCDMRLLGPMHVLLLEFLFNGETAADLSEAARERSLLARRYVPVNEATWQEILRYYLMFLVKQLQSGKENLSVRETLHATDISVSSVMSRAADGLNREDDLEDEDNEEVSINARRMARRAAKQKLIICRDIAMLSIIQRVKALSLAEFSGSASAEALLQFPTAAMIKTPYVPPPTLIKLKPVIPILPTLSKPKSKAKTKPIAKSKAEKKLPSNILPQIMAKVTSATISEMPPWAQKLMEIRDMPTNRGSKIRACVQDTLNVIKAGDESGLEDVVGVLSQLIKPGVFKSNAAGPCKRACLTLIAEKFTDMFPELVEARQVVQAAHAAQVKAQVSAEAEAVEVPQEQPEVAEEVAAQPEQVVQEDPEPPKSNKKRRKSKGDSNVKASVGLPATIASSYKPSKEETLPIDSDMLQRCRAIVRELSQEALAGIFCEPVDPEEVPDYLNLIKEPMDLRTIDRNLASGRKYSTVGDFARDLFLVWDNCMFYNAPASEIYKAAKRLKGKSEELIRAWIRKETRAARSKPYVWDVKLPDAPWTDEPDETSQAVNTPGAESGANEVKSTKKRKRQKATVDEYDLADELKAAGFKREGPHVGTRTARRAPDDSFDRGTILAYSDSNGGMWHVKFDDEGDAVQWNKSELELGATVYAEYSSAKKKSKKEKKEKRKKKKKEKRKDKNGSEGAEEEEEEAEAPPRTPDRRTDDGNTDGGTPHDRKKRKKSKRKKSENSDEDDDVAELKLEIATPDPSPQKAKRSKKIEEPTSNSKVSDAIIKEEAIIPDTEGKTLLRLDSFPEYAHIGAIVIKFVPESGCIEGVVSLYDEEAKIFTIEFPETEEKMKLSLDEIIELERASALLRAGSERNGVEDEEKELERIESLDPEKQRCYRRVKPMKAESEEANAEEAEKEDDDEDGPMGPIINSREVVNDPLAPPVLNRGKELGILRRLVVELGTKPYDKLNFELRSNLLRILCEQVGESATLRELVERRILITLKTRQMWRDQPPLIKRGPRIKQSKEDFPESLGGGEMAEQLALERQLKNFKEERGNSVSKNLLRAIERVEKDLEKQRKKKQFKDDARRWKSELEFKLQTVGIRPKVLGMDRFFNRYVIFPGDGGKIFVCLSQESFDKFSIEQGDSAWRVVQGKTNLSRLLNSLNPKGCREAALSHAIQSRSAIFSRAEKSIQIWHSAEAGISSKDPKGPTVKVEIKEELDSSKRQEVQKKNSSAIQNDEVKLEATKPTSVEDEERGNDAAALENLSLVGQQLYLSQVQKGLIKEFPRRFFGDSQAGIVLGEETVARHVQACKDASPEILLEGTYFERTVLDIKVFLLNMEYCVLLTRLDEPLSNWLFGRRKGWIRLVTSATNWRDLRQACCMLEVAFQEVSVPLENWYSNLYGDAGYALRTRTGSSLASRIAALDYAIDHEELSRQTVARIKASKNRNRKKRKR